MVRVENASAGTSYIARPGRLALPLLLAVWCALSGDVEAQAPRGGGKVKMPGADLPPNPSGPGAVPLGGAGGAHALGGPAAPVRQRGSPPTEQQIQAAIDRAAGHLLRQLPQLDGGYLSLAVLALLKAGVPADKPEMKMAIGRISTRIAGDSFVVSNDFNYDAGVTLMALANADKVKYRHEIEVLADFLIGNQGPEGDWDYRSRAYGDTSISQYAILGLWEASRAGVKVPNRVWEKAAQWHISRQLADGGFTYHPRFPGQRAFYGSDESTYTMTAAGTASLCVARLQLFPDAKEIDDEAHEESKPTPEKTKKKKNIGGKKFGVLEPVDPDEEFEIEAAPAPRSEPAANSSKSSSNAATKVRLSGIDKAIVRGTHWIEERFTIEPAVQWRLYYVYCIERLGALSGMAEFSGHDWYADGAEYLVSTQTPGGTWQDQTGVEPATSFGILFLVRATEKMLKRKPRHRIQKYGGGLLVGGRGLPENLAEAQLDNGTLKVRKLKGPVDELLAELENAHSQEVEAAQEGLVETVLTEEPEALIGQSERLLKLARDRRMEVRRTAYWALGRTHELRIIPVLIEGLLDPELPCMIEARNALQYVSKRGRMIELPDEPTDEQRAKAVAAWKKWYASVRLYEERDDLAE